jgi:hypothetical protein
MGAKLFNVHFRLFLTFHTSRFTDSKNAAGLSPEAPRRHGSSFGNTLVRRVQHSQGVLTNAAMPAPELPAFVAEATSAE